MKIYWDKINEMKLSKRGKLFDGKTYYHICGACAECGDDFISRCEGKNPRIYCSNKCAQSGKNNPAYGNTWNRGRKRPDARVRMLSAGNPNLNQESIKKRRASLGASGVLRGENNPNFKHGKYREEIRKSAEIKDWRKAVFVRDKFTCKMCNEHSHSLEAHHIKKFYNHKELRFRVDNGISLCRKCHELTIRKEEKFERLFVLLLEYHGRDESRCVKPN